VPLYEYQCDRDGRFERIQKFSDPPVKVCPKCGGPVQRLLSAPAIQFKGTGWYVTDYARKSGGEGSKEKETGGTKDTAASSSSSGDSASSGSGQSDAGKSEAPKKAAGSGGRKKGS
jgi:putative FmdB family regulatory protein